ncbi:hypothetical protein PTKIN_Ptkin08bG0178100 [Pterospermum kingtungense]
MLVKLPEVEVGKFAMLLWGLWRHRNDMVWKGEDQGVSAVIYNVVGFLYDWLNARRSLEFQSARAVESSICERWHCPPAGFVKCNVDAAFFATERCTGFGMVLRDEAGRFLMALTLWIEGLLPVKEDAKSVLEALSSTSVDLSEFGALVQGCRDVLQVEDGFSIGFARRSANVCAHAMARASLCYANSKEWSVPPNCIADLLSDVCASKKAVDPVPSLVVVDSSRLPSHHCLSPFMVLFIYRSHWNLKAEPCPLKTSDIQLMLRINHLHGLATRFRCWSRPIKCLHSLHQHKPKAPTKYRFTKTLKNPMKPPDVEPKVYMRDIISNIYKTLKYSTWDSAETQLKQLPIKWDSFTVNQVLKTHPPMEKAWLFFNWVGKVRGFKHDQFTYTTMLDIFGEAGRVSSMKYLFQKMQEKGLKIDAVTYTSVLHWISKSGDVDGAVEMWEEMRGNGCFPTVVSYTAYMKVLFDNKRVKEGTDVYKEMLQSGISPNCHTYTVLMEYLVGAGKWINGLFEHCSFPYHVDKEDIYSFAVDPGKYEEALEIFNKMQEAGVKPDKAACNILVEKCCKAGETRTIIQILQYMKENYIVLRYPVFLEALETFKVAGESNVLLLEVHPHISVKCIGNEREVEYKGNASEGPLSVDEGLVQVLLTKQNLLAIDSLLPELMVKNIQLDSEMISAIIEKNCNHCRLDGALLAFRYSVKTGLNLERTAYLSLIGSLIRSNTFTDIVEIVAEMTNAGHSLGVYQGSLLIYGLGCARRPTCAAKIFDLLPDDQKCVATYTALVGVYFAAGTADKGLKIYKTMRRKGIHPSLGTYSVLVAGLEKLGRVSQAETHRKEKKSLQKDAYFRASIPIEEKICDLLFARDVIS